MTISEKWIAVGGLPVHYWEGGESNGRALLLLPGGIGDACSIWRAALPALAESFHVFAPDLPGFGGSAALAQMSVGALIDWVRGLLDALRQPDIVIVGHSIGALLARLFASASPQYVPALILVNGGTLPKFPALVARLARLPVIGEPLLRLFGRLRWSRKMLDRVVCVRAALSDELRQAVRANAPGFVRLVSAFVRYPYPGQAALLMPTLLLWGACDPVMTLASAERLAEDIPGAQLEPIAECGHLPPLEASDAFVFQIVAFLEHMTRPTLPSRAGVGMLRSNPT